LSASVHLPTGLLKKLQVDFYEILGRLDGCSGPSHSLQYRLEEGMLPLPSDTELWMASTKKTTLITEIGFLQRIIAPKPYIPLKITYKRHILGTLTSFRNDMIPIAWNCAVWVLITSTPWNYLLLAVLGPEKPCAEIRKFFTGVCMCTPIDDLFQFWCSISGHKAASILWRKKNVLAPLGGTPMTISPNFLPVHTVVPHVPGFIQIRSGLGEL